MGAAIFYLLLAGGCAQIAGIEAWKPLDCSADENAMREECQLQAATVAACSQCLATQESKCTGTKDACTAEAMLCPPLLSCKQSCANPDDLLTCIADCCTAYDQTPVFDEYVSCLCGGCIEACDGVLPVCKDMCGVAASADTAD